MSTYLKEFADLMKSVILSKERLLVLGDFNIHVDVANDFDAVKFIDVLESVGLEQHVTEPTHIFGHRLYLFITRRTETLVGSGPRSCRYLSDHSVVRCSIRINKPRLKPRGCPSLLILTASSKISRSQICACKAVLGVHPLVKILKSLYKVTTPP